MLLRAFFTKKKKLFQKPFVIKGNNIYITDTKRAKKRFLKSEIKNVIFGSEFAEDEIIGKGLKRMYAYDEEFVLKYTHALAESLIKFLKLPLPVGEIAVFSEDNINCAKCFSRMVTVVGKGEDCVLDGVNVRFVKKIVGLPDIVISTGKAIPPLGVPTVDMRETPFSGHVAITWENMSFKCSLCEGEINTPELIFLLKTNPDMTYELTRVRKKLPPLFTFC